MNGVLAFLVSHALHPLQFVLWMKAENGTERQNCKTHHACERRGCFVCR
jgi:hypothetical protein